jgi:prepilin-type N-terminal cleavage/methylation domain-containing protein
MKNWARGCRLNQSGLTLMEILIALAIIGCCLVAVLYLDKTTWSNTRSSNKSLAAGQLIEKQVEYLRMIIASNPNVYFPDSLKNDSVTVKSIKVRWIVENAYDKNDIIMDNARTVTFTAIWNVVRPESLVVPTCIAKNF